MPSSSTNTYSCCIVCKGNHRLGDCRVFKERTLWRKGSLWRKINFGFRAYAISTHSASALNRESAELRAAIVRITHYCVEQIGFSQQNSQQILIPLSLLAKLVKVKQLLVKNHLIGPQQCHLLLMLKGFSRYLNCIWSIRPV